MEELHIYRSTKDLPRQFEWQIRTFLRILWFDNNEDDLNEPLTAAELHPVYFVLAREDSLVSYARLIWMNINHLGNSYKMYGLGDVFTFPASRNKGYGRRIVSAATDYIRADTEADVAILLTESGLENFYRSSGWEHFPELTLLTGEQANPQVRDDFAMMLFLSGRAKQNRSDFQTQSVFLPGDEW
jgi:aminoglycoside 2'-N-acetyltransferase I